MKTVPAIAYNNEHKLTSSTCRQPDTKAMDDVNHLLTLSQITIPWLSF